MRLPRMRFTVRRMMAVVALVALGFASPSLKRQWSDWGREYEAEAVRYRWFAWDRRQGGSDLDRRKAAYYDRMAEKYERAARYPWLSVPPDPPEPVEW